MHFVAAKDGFADFAIALLSGSVWRGSFHRSGATQLCHREGQGLESTLVCAGECGRLFLGCVSRKHGLN